MPPRDLDKLVEGLTADLSAYEAGLTRAGEVTAKVVARTEWRTTPPQDNRGKMTIKHEFDGAEREFRIERKYFPILEAGLGRSAYAVLKDMTEGRWLFNDVVTVISFGLYGASTTEKQHLNLALRATRYGMPLVGVVGHEPHPDVVKVLTRDGHGNFAELAAEVLADAIFGESADAPAA